MLVLPRRSVCVIFGVFGDIHSRFYWTVRSDWGKGASWKGWYFHRVPLGKTGTRVLIPGNMLAAYSAHRLRSATKWNSRTNPRVWCCGYLLTPPARANHLQLVFIYVCPSTALRQLSRAHSAINLVWKNIFFCKPFGYMWPQSCILITV